MATSRKPKFFYNKMHFCTLALPLVFFSLLFTKVVCVVFSSVLCFCVVKILDLDHKANSFPLFSTFFFCPHLSSLSLSLFLFFSLFVFFFFPLFFCFLSCCCLPTLCYLKLLPHRLITLSLSCRFVIASLSCCFIVALLLCYLIATSLPHLAAPPC